MFGSSTPNQQKAKKRDLSSPEGYLESELKLQRVHTSPETDTINTVMADTNITLDHAAIMSISAALSDTIETNVKSMMEASIKSIVDGVLSGLQSRITVLEDENKSLKTTNKELETRVKALEKQHDADEQYSKRNCLRISGITETKGEEPDKLVMDLCNTVGSNISLPEIDRCHRTGKPKERGPRDILVKFATYRSRQKLYTKRTVLKDAKRGYNRTFINEHLTRIRSQLLFEARKLVKEGKLVGAWSTDGNILIKVRVEGTEEDTSEIKRISSFDDLTPYK